MVRMVRETLSDIMERAGVTPVRLAAKSGVSVATIYRARGGAVPGDLHVAAIATALRVSASRVRSAIEASAAVRS